MNLSQLVSNISLHRYNLRKKPRLDYSTLYHEEYGDEPSTSDDDDGVYTPSEDSYMTEVSSAEEEDVTLTDMEDEDEVI